jgi:hypothetical protein
MVEVFIKAVKMNYFSEESVPISLSFSIDAVEDPSKIKGGHSKRTLTLPVDKHNMLVLGDWAETPQSSYNHRAWLPIRIDNNGITVFSGVCQPSKATLKGGLYTRKTGQISLILVENNAAWFGDMSARYLTDISAMVPEHAPTDDYIATKVNPVIGVDKFAYGLAWVKPWENDGYVTYHEHSLVVFLWAIIQEGFKSAGYTVASTFFSTDFFQRLVLPIVLDLDCFLQKLLTLGAALFLH